MPRRVDGKVAFVTGAARGQGRSHAVRLAEEGADIIAVDICQQVETVEFPLATPEDLAQTVELVEALDRRIVAAEADVRDFDLLKSVLDSGVAQLGRLDIVSANAGISTFGIAHELTSRQWTEMLDINLTGVWHTAKAAIPHLIEGQRGGAVILTSSGAGLKGFQNLAHYAAAKHGVIGLMRSLALELAPHMIRVNAVLPTSVNTDLIHNEPTYALFAPDLETRTIEDLAPRFQTLNALPIPWVEPVDISNGVLFLASDEARYVTGLAMSIDAGMLIK